MSTARGFPSLGAKLRLMMINHKPQENTQLHKIDCALQ
jgi:hypothetical protein